MTYRHLILVAVTFGGTACAPAEPPQTQSPSPAPAATEAESSSEEAAAADTRPAVTEELRARPNILLLVGDDIGLADIGAYGSEIPTPAIEQLAEDGLRFTNYHSSPVCSVTRSQMLTGNNNIEVGLAAFDYSVYPDAKGKPGYEGYLTRKGVMISELLSDTGYNTYHTGKWHLGGTHGGHGPEEWGFTHTYGIRAGGSNHFNNGDMIASMSDPAAQKAVEEGKVPPITRQQFFEDGQPVERPVGVYSDDLYSMKMMEYLEEGRKSGRPFFAYLAFTTAHFPIQAPSRDIDKYVEQYMELGYEGLKKLRLKNLKEAGIYPKNAPLPPPHSLTTPWKDLPEEEKRIRARTYATYAAMIESQDRAVGRILDYLRESGQLENTLIIYTTDNGPEGADAQGPLGNKAFTDWVNSNFSQKEEDIGQGNTDRQVGHNWANASTGALQGWKWFVAEGGTRVPLVVVPPSNQPVKEAGSLFHHFASVKDIAATILDYAGVSHPGETYEGRTVVAPSGVSIKGVLNGARETVRDEKDWVAFELFGNAYVVRGDLKLIRTRKGMYGDGLWHLYNIHDDPGETKPLEGKLAKDAKELQAIYEQYAKDQGIVPVAEDWNAFKEAGH